MVRVTAESLEFPDLGAEDAGRMSSKFVGKLDYTVSRCSS